MKKTTEVARRTRAAAERRASAARLTRLGSAVAIGLAKRYGWLEPVPTVLGSKLATIAIGAGVVAYGSRGTLSEIAEGIAESSVLVALYQGSSGGLTAISGDAAPNRQLPRRDSRAVAEQLRALSEKAREAARVSGDDDDDDDEIDD